MFRRRVEGDARLKVREHRREGVVRLEKAPTLEKWLGYTYDSHQVFYQGECGSRDWSEPEGWRTERSPFTHIIPLTVFPLILKHKTILVNGCTYFIDGVRSSPTFPNCGLY